MDAGDLLLDVGQLVDGTGAPPVRAARLRIRGSRIVAVGRAAEVAARPGDTVLDLGDDATALPGLIDAHTHLSLAADGRTYEEMMLDSDELMALVGVRNALTHLRSGVTTLRDNGGRNRVTFAIREAVRRGYVVGPRMLVSGRPVTPSGGHFHFCNGVADGPEGIRRAVRQLVTEGADHIKIMASGGATAGNYPYYASYTAAELRVAVETAHGLGRLTTAHCRARQSIANAVEAGLDCIEHAEFLEPPEVVPLGEPAGPGVIRYDPRLTERLLQAGTYISFTLQAGGWDSILRLRAKRAAEGLTAAEARQLDQLERHYDAKLELFQRLVRDGALPRLVVSSDAGPFDVSFGHLHYGLELAVQAGLAPREALQTVTKTAAEACGVSDLVGTLEPGKEADVLVVRGDPLEAIGAVANVVAVFKGGARVV